MARQSKEQRNRELEELNTAFYAAANSPRGITASLKLLAKVNTGRVGFSFKSLERKYALWRNERLQRAYKGIERESLGPALDWHGWTPERLQALFVVTGKTKSWFEKKHNLHGGSVSMALSGNRAGAHAQKTIDALVRWAQTVIKVPE